MAIEIDIEGAEKSPKEGSEVSIDGKDNPKEKVEVEIDGKDNPKA